MTALTIILAAIAAALWFIVFCCALALVRSARDEQAREDDRTIERKQYRPKQPDDSPFA